MNVYLWPLWSLVFGWDFVHAENSAASYIRRVRYTAAGKPYIVWFCSTWVWLDQPSGTTITPLTLRSGKAPADGAEETP